MITKIELHNFQSHKNTIIDFMKGVNVLCGESDNGKTAIIRAMRWVIENKPSGTDMLNSHWNCKFKEPMSVKLHTENGWVERIRTKDRNGYTVCNNNETIELSAVGRDVPQQVKEFLNLSDVNTQYQFDSPYLISMTAGEASKYLNNIIHLDSIDNMLSTADSNKREISAEQKIVEKDIKETEEKLEKLQWLDNAKLLQKKIDKYEELISEKTNTVQSIIRDSLQYEDYAKSSVDVTNHKQLLNELKDISDSLWKLSGVKDSIDRSVFAYKSCKVDDVDVTKAKALLNEIELIDVPDRSSFYSEIKLYSEIQSEIKIAEERISILKAKLPKTCPYCGSPLSSTIICYEE